MNKKILPLLILTIIILVACGKQNNNQNTDSTASPIPSTGPVSEVTPEPTKFPEPTVTPTPTATPAPTATPTPTPMPQFKDTLTETNNVGVFKTNVSKLNATDTSFVNSVLVGDTIVAAYKDIYSVDYKERKGLEESDEIPAESIYDEHVYAIETKNIITGDENRFFCDIESFSIPTLISIDNDTFCIVSSASDHFMIYNKDSTLLGEIILPSQTDESEYENYDYDDGYYDDGYYGDGYYDDGYYDDYYYFNTVFDKDTGTVYYVQESDNCFYKMSLGDESPTLIAQADEFRDFFSYESFSKNLIANSSYDYKTDLYSTNLIDKNTGNITTLEDSNYKYMISTDETEILLTDKNTHESYLYDVKNYHSVASVLDPEFVPDLENIEYKSKFTLSESDEIWMMDIDWANRLLLTHEMTYPTMGTAVIFKAYNLDDGSLFSSVSMRFDTTYFSPTIYTLFDDGYQIFTSLDNGMEFFAWDYINSGIIENKNLFVRTNYISPKLEEKRKEIEDKYNIFVYLGPEIGEVVSDYRMKVCYNQQTMLDALDTIEEALEIYPEDFFEQLKFDDIKTLGIYLCYGLEKNSPYSIDNAVAVATSYGYERLLAIDVNYSGDYLAETIIHEISHWIDRRIEAVDKINEDGDYEFEAGFKELNPKDFDYCYSYVSGKKYPKYVYNDYTNREGYFTDDYSQTYPTEDRARMFEYLVYDQSSNYMESPYIRAKLHYFFDYIREVFDTSNWPEMTVWEEKLALADEMYGEPEGTIEEVISGDTDSEIIATEDEAA